ncbi:MAG: DUF1080 domain-containing protein [Planctomycetales bacterium]|nr:DUF1080 domain-containing protein [Planctomycetales bacterium]
MNRIYPIPAKLFLCICLGWGIVALLEAAEMIETQDGVVGYDTTPLLPWCNYRKHDPARPQPKYVEPAPAAEPTAALSDAIVLFDGNDLSPWQPSSWKAENGYVATGKGHLVSKQSFGDCQLHLEFYIPEGYAEPLSDRGNSGVLLMEHYEIQIFDSHPSYKQQIYPDGQCAAIYGETPPMVNACRKAGQWQTYDIVFKAPVFEEGNVCQPAIVTVFHNGVLVHLNTEIHGAVSWKEIAGYKPHLPQMPLQLQGHGCPVRFRSIWIRPLKMK